MTGPESRDEVLTRIRLAELAVITGHAPGSDQLIRLGVEALLAGVGSPTLAELAGLTRAEKPEATALFRRVTDELGLTWDLPDDPAERNRALLRLWSGMLLDGTLTPDDAAERLYWPLYDLGPVDALTPLLTAVLLYEDGQSASPHELTRDLVTQARKFLDSAA
ncbi:hypothetical protein [Winogradskya humida]|uniref:TetR family transcriptional regulator n=1 Tax=Winogradskya humida TaxID=113566 RepID=A0ABQ3ZFH5_9ACTN|nr:hypothetical protein [Actinoplanes humidus]GIE17258.1 hypothetical protein Ahu01nite_003600 [Actinoplanes humidus]